MINVLSLDTILHASPPKTVKKISPSLRSSFQACRSIPLRRIADHPDDERARKFLFLLPRMILQHLKEGGKSKKREILVIHNKCLQFKWEELLQFNDSPQRKSSVQSFDVSKKNTALRLLKCGELSRAARILTSPGLAPASLDTRDKLTVKHPCGRGEPASNTTSSQGSISLSKAVLFQLIQRSPMAQGVIHLVGNMSTFISY